MIDPDAELILIDRFVADAAVVVRGARRWSAADSARSSARATGSIRSSGIVLPGNGVRVAPLPPTRRRRIVDGRHASADRFGEHALRCSSVGTVEITVRPIVCRCPW